MIPPLLPADSRARCRVLLDPATDLPPPDGWCTRDFTYHLPPELIAHRPPERRDGARMLVVHRESGTLEHRHFTDLPAYLRDGDLLALNDTRVVKARFFSEDGRIELLRLEIDPLRPERWRCLVKPGKKMRLGATVHIGGQTGQVTAIEEDGSRWIDWDTPPDEGAHGHLALPHYMERPDDEQDLERYQTTFANPDHAGAIAAPTAGLHFTPEQLATLPHVFLTLHVGVGTFQPVRAEKIADHQMHEEAFELTAAAAERLNAARRIVAVGTTVTRVLEHLAHVHGGRLVASRGRTRIFIHPPWHFQAVGALLTNFHLPQSTLLMLVSAFASRSLILRAYEEAVRERYRFFSYGDCMLIV